MITPLSLAVVTSCSNGYGKYLAEWAQSLCRLARKPTQVVIVTSGGLAIDVQGAMRAQEALTAAGLVVVVEQVEEELDLGVARNRAVALATTEWVMHLDADDMLMPHAVDDIARLVADADVVCLGYERCGDLASGPRNRTKQYRTTQGPSTLADPTPCSGVSPFRKTFWDRAPYATDLIGGWDTALWLGFAHLNARFVPTTRPCFWYRQHADSVFNVRRQSGWPASKAGKMLESRRRGDAGVSIIVPRSRTDSPARVKAWAWMRQRYAALFPEWEVVEGFVEAGPWIKAMAVYDALTRAHGRIIVIADADCILPPDTLRAAVERVRAGAPWVVPHRLVYRLDAAATARVLALDPAAVLPTTLGGTERDPYMGFAGGGVIVVGRPEYLATGGIPRLFVGWGSEDEAIALILDTLLGKHERLPADLVHLWHEPQATKDRYLSRGNRSLFQRYRQAAGDVDAMWQVIQPGRLGRNGGLTGDAAYLHASHAARSVQTRETIQRHMARG